MMKYLQLAKLADQNHPHSQYLEFGSYVSFVGAEIHPLMPLFIKHNGLILAHEPAPPLLSAKYQEQ
jgi:hypothetical protein